MEINTLSQADMQSLERHGYKAVRTLGCGSFSQVFLVKPYDGRDFFACKVSDRPDLADRESALLKEIDHPLFPRFYDLWQEGERVFLLMEYVCGSSLKELLHSRGSFSQAQTARVGMALAEGLRYLHQLPEPLLFRDVKPSNVMIRQDGRVKLLDLGCTCEMRRPAEARAGTPGYAAPEQLQKDGILSPACDVFALAKTLEAMAGKNVGSILKRLIEACTAYRPEDRLPDMQGVMAELAPLCGEGKGKGKMHSMLGFLQPRATCVKNVWESSYKNI